VGWSGAADRDRREPRQDVATVEHLGRTASAPHPLVSALTVNVVPADGGEHLVAGPVVHRVLEDGSSTGGRLGLLEGRYPAGWTGPPPHVHREHEETFYVLGGAMRFISGATERLLTAGGLITAPIGVPHRFGNASADQPAQLADHRGFTGPASQAASPSACSRLRPSRILP
jgi:mannose-6-phosphate isomerase-like protein (cupin superfamily)